ncbi:hypothetical protein [Falsibacillus pallidus]|uniref:Uncharacterized protein n=1 Tax=Falsibacillus pallidus TaxID=493781 RepID=A0A370GPI0_9BACI|nr:hypothetical protein [Falsibacillus pallidus]RDI45587.1 hypothetical protein DFR59_102215 [Falsibacillus pallidus]
MNKGKWTAAGITLFLLAFFLFLNWQYPYSFISVKKSIRFQPDPKVAEEYKTDFQSFRQHYYSNSVELASLTDNRTEFVLNAFDQKWLMSSEPVTMDSMKLNDILTEVQDARTLIMELAFRETYPQETKEYLKIALENSIEMESYLLMVKNNPSITRERSNSMFHQMHMMFQNELKMYESFYESYQQSYKK